MSTTFITDAKDDAELHATIEELRELEAQKN